MKMEDCTVTEVNEWESDSQDFFESSEEAYTPNKLHGISPYIGKMRPAIADWAIRNTSKENDWILDPFCGSGTVLLEAWRLKRNSIGIDLNPYAWTISMGKINPYVGLDKDQVIQKLDGYNEEVEKLRDDRIVINDYIKKFYHPDTAEELVRWIKVLKDHEDFFALSCLLGIAHHQRPGFLSYPSSHTTPYLREKKFPRTEYAEMYEYRDVKSRLQKKILRLNNESSSLTPTIHRSAFLASATSEVISKKIDVIITSPPYMGQLDYARDNRLRLMLLGHENVQELNKATSPNVSQFTSTMVSCIEVWKRVLKSDGKVAILIGETSNSTKKRLDEILFSIFSAGWPELKLEKVVQSEIPEERRARKNCTGSKSETLFVYTL